MSARISVMRVIAREAENWVRQKDLRTSSTIFHVGNGICCPFVGAVETWHFSMLWNFIDYIKLK